MPFDYESAKAILGAYRGLTPALRRTRKWCWIASTILGAVLALSAPVFVHFASLQNYLDGPLLGGPAGLTLFAIVVALSAYLRGVAGDADKKRGKIRANKDVLYPVVKPEKRDGRTACTEARLEALDDSFGNLHIAAYFLIALSLALGLRLFAESISRLSSDWLQHGQLLFRVCDALILEWLLLALVVLAVMHRRARIREEVIRDCAESCRIDLDRREEDAPAPGVPPQN